MDELLAQFVIEAPELVQQAMDDLLVLERDPADAAALNGAFRAIHTLKGSVGLFELPEMQRVLHAAEELLDKVRNSSTTLLATNVDALLHVLDWTSECTNELAAREVLTSELKGIVPALLDALADTTTSQPNRIAPPAGATTPDWVTALLAAASNKLADRRGGLAWRYRPHRECFFSGDDALALVTDMPGLLHLEVRPAEPWPALTAFDPFASNFVIEGLSDAPRSDIEALFRLLPDQVEIVAVDAAESQPKPAAAAPTEYSEQIRTLRVDAGRIDTLVDLVGELVIAKNGLSQVVAAARQGLDGEQLARRVAAAQQDIDRLTGELHGAVMRTRMVAIGETFRRFPRLVRETAAQLGKPVDLVLEGEAVEADRAIVEDLFEPLLHLVRNGLDHGLETPAERASSGKPPRGLVKLSALQRGGQIVVQFSDDGRGIDAAAIRDSAVAKELITRQMAGTLSEAASLDLVFSPGFSTAASVTALSGRGVGLDAVKAAVQRLGGSVLLSSTPGAGTTVELSVPVSFAMSRLIVVEVAGERYGVPLEAVLESVRLAPSAVVPIRAGAAFVLRNKTVPLLRLGDLLGLNAKSEPDAELKVLIVRSGADRVGIAVDRTAERAETMTRPMGGLLAGLPGIAGTALLGDGRVLMVLDLEALVR